MSEIIRAKIVKDPLPGRLLPWKAEIKGQITITFQTWDQAMLYANHRVGWLRQDFADYVQLNRNKVTS